MLKLITLLFLAFILASSICYACSCATPSLKTAVKESKAVFSGEVVSVDHDSSYKVVTLNVMDGWKGVDKSQITVVTEEQGESCGYYFLPGKKYLVFARFNPENKQLTVNLCDRTKILEDANEDLKKLGQPKIRIVKK